MELILIYVVVVNATAFLMYGIDKWNAKRERRRIPEKTLLGIAAIGGSIGAYAGMQLFHHKTRKPKFYIGIPLIFAIQLGILVYIYR
ncbi:MAG: DUF1294 domain-containing protein [Tyzzerella sp.]|nr:DUF1294 domain-containing protein [Tyzzerella sp.]